MSQESTRLRDEVDILRHTAEKLVCICISSIHQVPICLDLPGGWTEWLRTTLWWSMKNRTLQYR